MMESWKAKTFYKSGWYVINDNIILIVRVIQILYIFVKSHGTFSNQLKVGLTREDVKKSSACNLS